MKLSKNKNRLTCFVLALASVQNVHAEENIQNAEPGVLELPVVEIVGQDENLKQLPGAVNVLKQEELFNSHVYNINEALRKVSGVNVRDEEGFGMRPNIGIRGMNPTRST